MRFDKHVFSVPKIYFRRHRKYHTSHMGYTFMICNGVIRAIDPLDIKMLHKYLSNIILFYELSHRKKVRFEFGIT